MPDNTNPYLTVGSPNYAAPLMDWQGMAKGLGDALQKKQQPQPGQPGAPMDIRSQAQMQGMPAQPGQQPQGWGARLAQMFNIGGQPQPQLGGPQPPIQSAPGPTGIY